jgi:hypothetical protein
MSQFNAVINTIKEPGRLLWLKSVNDVKDGKEGNSKIIGNRKPTK